MIITRLNNNYNKNYNNYNFISYNHSSSLYRTKIIAIGVLLTV